MLLESERVGTNEIVPEVVDELELGPNVHALVDDLLETRARRLAQVHVLQRVREELDETLVHDQTDLDPRRVLPDHLLIITLNAH